MKQLCIIGLGWLGVTFGEAAKDNGYTIIGTSTKEDKKERLASFFSEVLIYSLGNSFPPRIASSSVYVFTIPPSADEDYIEKCFRFFSELKKQQPKARVFYLSSTSVYGSAERVVDETSETMPETNSAKKVSAVETMIQELFFGNFCILRLGGLVGGERHPVKYLSGKTNVAKPKAGVNLVHREDVIKALLFLIDSGTTGIFNLCSPEHPEKTTFYNQVAEQNGYKKVVFNESDKRKDKIVTCQALEMLNFEFKFKSVYEFTFQ